MKKFPKKEAEKQIKEFFKNLKGKNPCEIKKIKKLAMRHNIKLREKRKLFCKKCYTVFNTSNSETRIKKGKKTIKCKNCDYVNRWEVK